MFGMEKKKDIFEFDLESDIKKDPNKKKEYLDLAEENIQTLKTILRDGIGMDHFDDYGILLQGYTALQKVLNRASSNRQGGK